MPLKRASHSPLGTEVEPVSVDSPARLTAPQGTLGKLAFPMAFLAIGFTVAVLFFGILKLNNGTFVYTLDDPYIHLAVSDQIRHGNYGLYPGTHAAPSSSILFPFLLATLSGTAIHPYFPLILNIFCLFATAEIMRRFLLQLELGRDDFALCAQAFILFLVVLGFNLIGVVFTGLEHSLHIALVAAVVYGLSRFLDVGKMPLWLPLAIILCPLVRYEGLALSLGAVLALAIAGRWRTAFGTVAITGLLVGGFSLFLHKLGLPLLPSSILSKSAVVAGGVSRGHANLVSSLSSNFDVMIKHPTGMALLLTAVVGLCLLLKDIRTAPTRWTSNGLMALPLLSAVAGQTLAGRFGWLERYEIYIMVVAAMIGTYFARSIIRSALAPESQNRTLLVGGVTGMILVFGLRYYRMTALVPHTSNNIYEQQLQMHHFVSDFWRGPVAINDLGLVSYHNAYPVLDLGGLGSEKARMMIVQDADAEDYDAFIAANGVHLVIIYDEWFRGRVPEEWHKAGTLSLSRSFISAANSNVQFYATDEATYEKVHGELADFQKTLPPRVKLALY